MSMATRCTSCGTVFRVVQNQLKVSEGWVRCGNCNDVFNALETLFNLDLEAPPDWTPPPKAPPAAPRSPAPSAAPHSTGGPALAVPPPTPQRPAPPEPGTNAPGPAAERSLVEELDARIFGTRRPDFRRSQLAPLDPRDQTDFSDARFDTDVAHDDDPALDIGSVSALGVDAGLLEAEHVNPPGFLRQAVRDARWQDPRVRRWLSVAASGLAALAVLQVSFHFRDSAAARWPAAKPLLVAGCKALGCSVEAPRRIDDISVDSTALSRANAPDAFRLAVTLRNHGSLTLAMPSVDLSLTDSNGRLIARRALTPADFRVTSTVLGPGAEAAMQLVLSAGDAGVSGYTVEIFYP